MDTLSIDASYELVRLTPEEVSGPGLSCRFIINKFIELLQWSLSGTSKKITLWLQNLGAKMYY